MPTLTKERYRRHKSNGRYEVRFYLIDGARKLRLFRGGFPRKYDAEVWFLDYRAQVEAGEVRLDPATGRPQSHPGDLTLRQLADRLQQATEGALRPSSAKSQRFSVERFLEALGPNTRASAVTTHDIEQFIARRRTTARSRGKEASPHTLNRDLEYIRKLFNAAVRWQVVVRNPASGIRRSPHPEGRVVYLSLDDQAKLVGVCRSISQGTHNSGNSAPYLYPMVTLALRTGLRRGELFHLRWSCVDFTRAQLRILPSASWAPKSGRARVVGLDPDATEALTWWRDWFPAEISLAKRRSADATLSTQLREKARHRVKILKACSPAPDSLVFPSFHKVADDGAPAPLDNIASAWATALTAAFGEDPPERLRIGMHALRHTFAVTAARAGVPLPVLSRLLGHADIQTTMIYLRFYPDDPAAAAAALLPRIPLANCGGAVVATEPAITPKPGKPRNAKPRKP